MQKKLVRLSSIVVFALTIALAAGGMNLNFSNAKEKNYSEDRIPGQYIIVFKDSVVDPEAETQDMIKKHRAGHLQTYKNVLKGFAATMSDAEADAIKKDPRVQFVSEDRVVSISRSSSSRIKPSPVQKIPTGVNRIGAAGLPNKGVGVNVAIIDTGIDLTHPDLAANIAGGKNCSSGTSYTDGNGHGTHVAGTVAALDNNIGAVGVAPQAKLWAVRVLDNNGNGTWSSVICGVDFVTGKAPANGGPITVANMSLGGLGVSDGNCGNTNSDALHKAICRSRDAGVTYVVAAGNENDNAANHVPASYDDAVITVSALVDSDGNSGGLGSATYYGADDTFASFSNYGSIVDLGAPGVNIFSTWKGGGYNTISGTSMASPHVAGAAALYIASGSSSYLSASFQNKWQAVRDALVLLGEANGFGHSGGTLHNEPVVKVNSL